MENSNSRFSWRFQWLLTCRYSSVMRCVIRFRLYNLKNVKNTCGGTLLLVKVTLLHGCFPRFQNRTGSTKPRLCFEKSKQWLCWYLYQLDRMEKWFSFYKVLHINKSNYARIKKIVKIVIKFLTLVIYLSTKIYIMLSLSQGKENSTRKLFTPRTINSLLFSI